MTSDAEIARQIREDVSMMADFAVKSTQDKQDEVVKLAQSIVDRVWRHDRSVALVSMATALAVYAEAVATENISQAFVMLVFEELTHRLCPEPA